MRLSERVYGRRTSMSIEHGHVFDAFDDRLHAACVLSHVENVEIVDILLQLSPLNGQRKVRMDSIGLLSLRYLLHLGDGLFMQLFLHFIDEDVEDRVRSIVVGNGELESVLRCQLCSERSSHPGLNS
jgi:hypothetical protein